MDASFRAPKLSTAASELLALANLGYDIFAAGKGHALPGIVGRDQYVFISGFLEGHACADLAMTIEMKRIIASSKEK